MNEHADFVSRAGGKLAHALDVFEVRPVGWICADLGSHVGGFVDCLLRRGAVRVYAVDTAYGTLAWRLRRDDRVVVRERTNALHVALPEPVDLVTIDVGWTRQLRILDHARNLLAEDGRIITLIKPQYEAEPPELQGGVVREACLDAVSNRVRDQVAALGLTIDGWVDSPLIGHGGNREMLALLRRAARAS